MLFSAALLCLFVGIGVAYTGVHLYPKLIKVAGVCFLRLFVMKMKGGGKEK